ncbi:hypothetical protein AVEN_228256-1 [Araneus ventricosus]|uniref:RNase H type-1 domain-containing protein n=1 Tax=Araneus ventricosus TaxID=182803 RepID=A0A4Y2V063_ARAVE|nr:hypothetical protein AVEN_21115-1 [Araneus ventricosus]GBO24521.1 hypothetical protein AVEN_228256-1 [Araneus ventricosus]
MITWLKDRRVVFEAISRRRSRYLPEKITSKDLKLFNVGQRYSHWGLRKEFDSHRITPEILLKSTNIKLGWIKAHVGYSGNEAADVLAKKATQEGIPTYIRATRNHIKNLLQKESISRWQKEWDNGEAGRRIHNVLPKVKTTPTPWQRPEILFVTGHGPFPTYLKRFNIRNSDSCGCGNLGNLLPYATSCLFTTSYHLTKPSADLEPLWWERVMNNNNSRAKNRKLIHFIAENGTFVFPKDGDNN